MSITSLAGVGGIGFVALAVATNLCHMRSGLPQPMSNSDVDRVTDDFAAVGAALRGPAVLAPAMWLGLTVFAGGLLAALWGAGPVTQAWALVGLGGVLMQNVTFTCVEALRFGLATAANHHRGSVAGLWSLSNTLFGFNQVFLAVALLGFTVAGAATGLAPGWHAWLGYTSAALLFVSSSASAYNAAGANRFALVGLVGWLGWAAWIVSYGVILLGL